MGYNIFQIISQCLTLFPFIITYIDILTYTCYTIGCISIVIVMFLILFIFCQCLRNLKYSLFAGIFYILLFSSTILYVPLFGNLESLYFLGAIASLSKCKNSSNNWVAYSDPQTGCFSGSHILPGSICIVVGLIFFILTLLFRTFCFSNKISIHDPYSRLDAKAFPLFHSMRTFLIALLYAIPNV